MRFTASIICARISAKLFDERTSDVQFLFGDEVSLEQSAISLMFCDLDKGNGACAQICSLLRFGSLRCDVLRLVPKGESHEDRGHRAALLQGHAKVSRPADLEALSGLGLPA